ncbi:GerAB/ArcD/ProY family transporter [Paenibacillus thermotolerans]|uniref:GerAB/ArcD/ProY family transporter n=1 Tax=Paenibacillus thermotolerans TaxID=3027807 RepID=UPI002368372F|nr:MULTISPECIES: GerAB/ArcD/ProY family transporter [unclassified Paenibacillus]
MLMVLTFASDSKNGPAWAAGGFALSAALVCMIVASVVMTLGPEITAKENYPAFDAISFINVMNFIQNLEIVAILTWILSVFIKISLYVFLAGYGTAKLFRIKNWRKTIWFTVAFVFAEAMIMNKLNVYDAFYHNNYWIPIALPVNMAAIPLLLWIVGKLKQRNTKAHYKV